MKTLFSMMTRSALPVMVALSFVSVAKADPKLVLDSGSVDVISGSARSTTKISVRSYYMPAYQFAGTAQPAECNFPNDTADMIFDGIVATQNATKTANGYTVSVPLNGMRGGCAYVLNKGYIYIDDGKAVSDSYQLQSSASIAAQNKEYGAPPEGFETPEISALGPLYCDYSSTEPAMCVTKDDQPPEPLFSLSSTPSKYTLDIKDSSKMAIPKY